MSTDRTNAERQRRFRERNRVAREDQRILDAIREQVARDIAEGNIDPSGAVIRVPASLSREEWAAFIDREDERRGGSPEPTDGDQ